MTTNQVNNLKTINVNANANTTATTATTTRGNTKATFAITDDMTLNELIILYYNQDMTLKEIGTTLNISSPAVLFRLNGAKRKLRKNMERFL